VETLEKKDDIKELFDWSVIIEKFSLWIFWLNVGLASVNYYIGNYPYKTVIDNCQFALLLIYVMLSTLNDKWFLYNAEAARRRNAVENAFQSNMSDKKTDGYYNNQIKHPLQKYVVNLFESCFYSKNIAGKMVKNAIIKLIGITFFCFLAYSSIHDSGWLMIISQTVFSTVVVSDLISVFFYHDKLEKIYNNLYEHMITIREPFKEQMALLLNDVVEYEAVKAHFKVRLDEKIYNENNATLSKEWKFIEEQITFERIKM
jgi:hypothetical protein